MKTYSIRRDVLNLTVEHWKIAGRLDLSAITPAQWLAAFHGPGGFLTAKLNAEEQEFADLVYSIPTEKP